MLESLDSDFKKSNYFQVCVENKDSHVMIALILISMQLQILGQEAESYRFFITETTSSML